jgi:hypothetical protein
MAVSEVYHVQKGRNAIGWPRAKITLARQGARVVKKNWRE